MTDLRIEYRPLDSVVAYARNARTHSDAQVAQLAASIREADGRSFVDHETERHPAACHPSQ